MSDACVERPLTFRRSAQTGFSHWLAACLIAFFAAMSAAASAWAESPVPQLGADRSISNEQIESAIVAIKARDELDEETRRKVIDQLRDAQAQLQNATSTRAAAAALAESIQTAPAETEKLRKQLDDWASPTPDAASIDISEALPLPELEQALTTKLAEIAAAEARLERLDSQIETLANQPAQARARITELRGGTGELQATIDAETPPGEAAIVAEARRLATQLRLDARTAELNRLEQEIVSNKSRLDLARAHRDIAARVLAGLRRDARALQRVVNEKRQISATQALQETTLAELAAAGKHQVVRKLAEGSVELTRELPVLAADIERVTAELSMVEEQARQIEQSLALSRQQLAIGGVTQVIGRLFVEERRNLPQVSQYRAQVRDRRKTLSNIGLALIRIEEQRRELTPLDNRVEMEMSRVREEVANDQEIAVVRGEIELLLRNRRDLLSQVASMYTSYIRALGDIDVAQRRLLDAADEYKQFLDQNLLWIPSAKPFWIQHVENLGPASAWALSPTSWSRTAGSLREAIKDSPLPFAAAILLLGLLLFSWRPLTVRFKALNRKVGRPAADHIGLTLGALGISAARALPLPLMLAVFGWGLTRSPLHTDFTAAVAASLHVVAPFLYNTLLFRILCARNGVMQIHFGWSVDRLPVIRKQLDRLTLVGAPVIFVAVLVFYSPTPAYRESLGRLAFIIAMAIFTGAAHALLHPRSGVAAAYYRAHAANWLSRLRWLWYVLGTGSPVLLALASLLGFLYTAATLTGHLVDTFWLILAIIVINLVVTRWLALARRRIAWAAAREAREEKRAVADGASGPDSASSPIISSTALDLDSVDQQTRRLVNAGLILVAALAAWGIWSEVVPALSVLDQVSLWSQTTMIDGVEAYVPVTLGDLLLAVVVAVATVIAATNLPGLMEIAVLQRITLQPGSRYAINTLLRYFVITIGVIAILNIVGWKWSQIQWLVAALSVGLGFGLQEIVANFVSGLVILFERPVRVGDTVTVGEVTGTVSRVRIRATTITDWDRKEIIVPNKSFITEQVINWTLSDPITRTVIPVGIAYGSDVKLAHEIMRNTLAAMPLVLDEPPPKVYFMGFGDSSLKFNLYVHSRELSDRLPMMHAVHEEILSALRKNNIEIPFPQRDLHLRSAEENVTVLNRSPTGRDDQDD